MKNDDLFEVIRWPEVQDLMEEPGFRENSSLVSDDPLYSEYGDQSYFVRKSWLESLGK